MPRKCSPPSKIQVPQPSPRSHMIRVVESDGEWSATRPDFDIDELSDASSEASQPAFQTEPRFQQVTDRDGLRGLHGSHHSTFGRIVERMEEEALENAKHVEDYNSSYKPLSHGFNSHVCQRVSISSPITNRFRSSGPSWPRILSCLSVFVWMTLLYIQEDNYYASIPAFKGLHRIIGGILLAELAMDMPAFSRAVERNLGRRTIFGKSFFRTVILLGYMVTFGLIWVRALDARAAAFAPPRNPGSFITWRISDGGASEEWDQLATLP